MALEKSKIGKVITQVGTVKGKQLRFLAHVSECNKEECPIGDQCPFEPRGRCKVIYDYLSSLYRDWVDPRLGIGDLLNQIQLDRIGSHLMPLYHQLARFSLDAANLSRTTYVNKQGTELAYPHFNEIRMVLQQIRAEMKDLKLEALWDRKFSGVARPSLDVDAIMHAGRMGAYEEMVERARRREIGAPEVEEVEAEYEEETFNFDEGL